MARCALLLSIGLLLVALAGGADDPPDPAVTEEALDARAGRLREKLGASFTVVTARPFVVAGDEAPAVVRRRAEGTVAWAVRMLRQQYFPREPDRIIDVYLFKDKESYEANCKKLFGQKPHTPFGFYSRQHDALIMNIATGGGTLVHEIVHPFMEANFPDCPAWFNEGLGSLYEQCGEREGKIVGFTNWRLAGLQKTIRQKKLPPFEDLCGSTTHQFYNMDRGSNYGQARYLCYYLQQRGLLETYYKAFVAAVEDDPTGFATLQQVLGVKDMTRFQADWEAWVLKLKFPDVVH